MFKSVQSWLRGPRLEISVLTAGLCAVLIVGSVGMTQAYASLTNSDAELLAERVSMPGFTAARCPEDWAQTHGRITGLGVDGMVALLRNSANTETPDSVRAALLTFKADPSKLLSTPPEEVAQLQVYYCLADAWDITLM